MRNFIIASIYLHIFVLTGVNYDGCIETLERFLMGFAATGNKKTVQLSERHRHVETFPRCLRRPRIGAAGNEEEHESDSELNLAP